MKIVCVGYMHGKGGAERQLIMLANDLAKDNDVYLAVLCQNNIKYDIAQNITVIDLTHAEKGRFKTLSRWRELYSVYKKINPDLTIHFWLQSAYLTAFLPVRIRGHIVYSERNDPNDIEYKGLNGLLRKMAFPRISGFVFQTVYAQKYFPKSIQSRSRVIHNPVSIDDSRFNKPCSCRKPIIISAGRLVERKNQRLLISAFSRIADEIPEFLLSIYGDGPLLNDLIQLVHEKHIDNRVRILESTDNIFERVYESSLFVLTSEYEGMPNALMEALALGTPCISTDCRPGGARALITDGVNGYIVPTGDEERLAESMLQILSSPRKAQAMGEEAMKIRETHAPDVVYQAWRNFFFSVCTQ